MSNEIRCNGCREWFDSFLRECPKCNHKRPEWNKWLRTAQLNQHMLDAAKRAHANR
jgi:hypothetical protein